MDLPLLVLLPEAIKVCFEICCFRFVCLPTAYPSACQHVSKLDLHISGDASPWWIVHTINSFTLKPHLL